MQKLILVRHGQSQWNLENRFTGWVNAPLTEKGIEEAKRAGELLIKEGLAFDYAFTSYLERAIETLWQVLKVTDRQWIPVEKDWRLNERHYGGLQGLNKKETAEKHGKEQVFQWRRSYDIPPPKGFGPLQEEQINDPRYQEIPKSSFPSGESLELTVKRVIPYWESHIEPQVKAGKTVLVAAHGNSLRALVKHLAGMDSAEITGFEFPTGVPLICDLKDSSHLQSMNFLG